MTKMDNNITDICATANASVATMELEIAGYKNLVATVELICGGTWDGIMPSRKGNNVQKFKYYFERFEAILHADKNSTSDYGLALTLIHERLWRLANIIKNEV